MPEVPHITVKMPGSPALGRNAQNADLIWVWDSVLGKLTQSPVSSLPFSSGGAGGGGTLLGSPFKVRSINAQVTITEVTPGVWNTVISDTRLLGKTDYPVSCTQLNNASFRDSELTYDSVAGKVTLLGFKLANGEIVILYPDGVAGSGSGSGGGSVAVLQDQIDELKRMMAPFIPTVSGANGGLVLWGKPAIDIPVGWQEATDWRGRMPMGMIPSDLEFGYGLTGGASTHTNTLDEMFPHDHVLDERPTGGDWRTSGGSGTPLTPGADATPRRTLKTGGYEPAVGATKVAKPYSILNPFRIVMFIKYVGI